MSLIQAITGQVRFVMARFTHIALLLLVGGCSPIGWRRADLPPRVNRRQFQIWSGGAVTRWHGVLITCDSVSGIPYDMPLDCDTCRRSMACTQVDSIREAKGSYAEGA